MIHWGGFTHLLGPPAAAVDGLVADVLHVEAVHYFGAVFVDWHVDPALGAALWTEVACQQVGAQSRGHCNGNDGGQLICKCTHEEALVFWQGREVPAHYSTSITIFIVNFGSSPAMLNLDFGYDNQVVPYKTFHKLFFSILDFWIAF